MSKTSDLRREATDAVRAQKWDRAIECYRRLCEVDTSNASIRNELGDVHLKRGDVADAIGAFSTAATLYCAVGLTNNAVALHKKILRHDPNQLDSLWGLGDIRLQQNHEAEAASAFLEFLGRADQVTEAGRDGFVRRCEELIDRMSDDLDILSRVEAIFRGWSLAGPLARVLLAKAMQAQEAGEFAVRDKYIEHARESYGLVDELEEYRRLQEIIAGPVESPAVDPGTIELDAVSPDEGGEDRLELDADGIDLGFDFDEKELSGAVERVSGPVSPVDEEAASPEPSEAPTDEEVEVHDDSTSDVVAPDQGAADEGEEAPVSEDPAESTSGVDLLEEILSDPSFDVVADAESQVDTIAREMEGQIAGSVDASDHAGLYELGIVYMDMALNEQAIEAFDRAAQGPDQQLKAMEMKGTCLLRCDRVDEAMGVFEAALAIPGHPERAYAGLHYGVGSCHELRGEVSAACESFERVSRIDAAFGDVKSRLSALRTS